MASGQSFSEAVGNIDYADVAIASAEYGLAGLTNGASLAVSGKISDALQASVDINGNGEVSAIVGGFNGGESKDIVTAGTEFVVGKAVGNVAKKTGDAINSTIENASSNLAAKAKNLTKANNAVANGNTRSKAQLPSQALKEFSAAKDKAVVANAVEPIVSSQTGKGAGDLIKMSSGSTSKSVTVNLLDDEKE